MNIIDQITNRIKTKDAEWEEWIKTPEGTLKVLQDKTGMMAIHPSQRMRLILDNIKKEKK